MLRASTPFTLHTVEPDGTFRECAVHEVRGAVHRHIGDTLHFERFRALSRTVLPPSCLAGYNARIVRPVGSSIALITRQFDLGRTVALGIPIGLVALVVVGLSGAAFMPAY